MVYRGSPTAKPRRARGNVIDEMVSQFADRYAFVRELVQNAIDAGASKIAVRVETAEGRTRTSVEDDGCGMTLAIIEGPLVTLFSSSKEGQEGKIGRYGVGFMSVFAVDPTEVEVDTRTAEGRYLVRIFRDQSYEISELPPREGTGTTVTLLCDGEPADDHEARVESAIVRWCRHVRIPVQFDAGRGARSLSQPFDIVAPVVLRAEKDGISVVVGPSAGTDAIPSEGELPEGRGDYAGFFARGLTLHETTDRALVIPGVRFKVESAALAHTLSRDNVRRDAAYERAMRLVRPLVQKLDEALSISLRGSAARVAAGSEEPLYEARVRAAGARLRPSEITLPLVVPIGVKPTMTLADLLGADKSIFVSAGPCDASRALAARGIPVVHRPSGTSLVVDVALAKDVSEIQVAYALDGSGFDPIDLTLFDRIGKAICVVAREDVTVVFGRFRQTPDKARPPLSIRDVIGAPAPWTAIPRRLDRSPKLDGRALHGVTLVVNVDNGVVFRARKLAARGVAASNGAPTVEAVAAIVARLVHLEHAGAVERDANDALLDFVAEADHAG